MFKQLKIVLAGTGFLLLLALANCGTAQKPVQQKNATPTATPSSTLRPPAEDGQWTAAAKDPGNTRFSDLNQITTANVGQLKRAWSHVTGLKKGHEAAPLVVGDTMYIVTPLPNLLIALISGVRTDG